MKCMHCQGEMKTGDAPLHIDCKGCHVTLEKVPAWVCMQCGEPYFEEAEVNAIQELAQTIQQYSAKGSRIVIDPVRRKSYKLDELIGDITGSKQHKPVDTGAPVGKEVW